MAKCIVLLEKCMKIQRHASDSVNSITLIGLKRHLASSRETLFPLQLFHFSSMILALEIKLLNRDLLVNSKIIRILMYADDVVVLSETENKLQVMLNTINTRCNKWKLLISETKSNVIHFRPKRMLKSKFSLKLVIKI